MVLRRRYVGRAMVREAFAFYLSVLWAATGWVTHARGQAPSGVNPSIISLPQGPGSIEGLGASFEPNAQSGGASYRVPFQLPPAVGGLVPSLGLAYSTGTGVSEVGLGWTLTVPSVRRRTENGVPHYDESDTFALSGLGADGDLIQLDRGEYRMRFESAFVRVRRKDDLWEIRERSGVTHYFGEQSSACDGEPGRCSRWHLTRTVDLHGHEVIYEYSVDGARAYLSRVRYGGAGAAEVVVALAYAARPDVVVSYQSGSAVLLTRRLSSVAVTRGEAPVATYAMRYKPDPGLSRLAAVEMFGADGITSMPNLQFEYGEPSHTASQVVTFAAPPGRGLVSRDAELVDINGDGTADLLWTESGRYTVYLNRGGRSFDAPFTMASSPSVTLTQTGVQLADVDGDAAVDLLARSSDTAGALRYFQGGNARAFGASHEYGTAPSVAFEDPDVRLVDLDFDRRTDLLFTSESGPYAAFNTGAGFTKLTPLPEIDSAQTVRLSDPRVRLADCNGDRLQDLVYVRPESVRCWPSRGRGAYASAIDYRNAPALADTADVHVSDMTGDGLPDLVRVGVTQVEVWINRADGSFSAEPITVKGTPERGPNTAIRLADMNGNGTVDILWADTTRPERESWRYLDLVGDATASLLTRIDNGLGAVTTMHYRPSAAYADDSMREGRPWRSRLPTGMALLASVSRDDSLGTVQTTRFSYRDGLYDGPTREFRGFGATTQIEVGDAAEGQPSLMTTLEYDQGEVDEACKGRTLRVTRADEAGAAFNRVATTYDVVTLAAVGSAEVRHCRARRTETVLVERGDAPVTTRTETDYDAFGNVTATREWGVVQATGGVVDGDERFSTLDYAVNEADWVLDRLASEQVADAEGKVYAARRLFYDGDAFVGLPLGRITRGDLTREEAWLGPAPDSWLTREAYARDAHGNLIEQRDGDARRKFVEWDVSTNAFPVRESVLLETGRVLQWSARYDARWGVVTSSEGPAGERTRYAYDALGRMTAVWEPGDDEPRPTWRFGYHAGAPLSRVESAELVAFGSDAYRTRIMLIAGTGAPRASLVPAPQGGWVASAVARLGPRGAPRARFEPFLTAVADRTVLDGGSALATHIRYDAVGREVGTTLPDGEQTRVERRPLTETSFDADDLHAGSETADTPDVVHTDGLGRTVRIEHLIGTTLDIESFAYDPLGRVAQRTDPIGTMARYRYDGLGRRTETRDPDGGARTARYDAAGHVVAETNARGQTVTARYDGAGRVVAQDLDGDGREEVTYRYDEGCAHGAGRLCGVEEPSWSMAMDYDARGRVEATRYRARGAEWRTRDQFDPVGRLIAHVYPDGSAVDLAYDARGNLDRVGRVVLGTEYNAQGAVVERRYAHGVLETRAYDTRARLEQLRYAGAQDTTLEHLKLRYSATTRVLELTDLREGRSPQDDRSEVYRHDARAHLTHAGGMYGEIRWEYDAAHRLLARTAEGAAAATMDLGELTYPDGTDASGPHAPRRAGTHVLEWDADGNLAALDARPFAWDARGHVIRAPGNAGEIVESVYDASGVRRIETVVDGRLDGHSAVFLSAFEMVRDGRLIRMVPAGNETVFVTGGGEDGVSQGATAASFAVRRGKWDWLVLAVAALSVCIVGLGRRVPQPQVVVWLALLAASASIDCGEAQPSASALDPVDGTVQLRDARGATLASFGPQGSVVGRDVRYPGGAFRSSSGALVHHTFSGSQPQRSAQLAFVGPRVLLPALGLWASVDPVAFGGGTVAPYTYVDGDPASHTDDDGRERSSLVDRTIGSVADGLTRFGEGLSGFGEQTMNAMPLPTHRAAGMSMMGWGMMVSGVGRGLSALAGVGPSGEALSNSDRMESGLYSAVALGTPVLGRGVAAAGAGVVRAARPYVLGLALRLSAITRAELGVVASGYSAGAGRLSVRFTQKDAGRVFSDEGRFRGETVSSLASKLRLGQLSPRDVPVNVVNLGSIGLAENTRSALALTRAGVPQSEWSLQERPDMAVKIFRRLIDNELSVEGSETLRIRGSGVPKSSSIE
jgi:RHS repeat-associated protein